MSEEMKKELEEAIEQLRQLPPEKQNMCTGFVLGVHATSATRTAGGNVPPDAGRGE